MTRRIETYLPVARICLSTQNFRPSFDNRVTLGAHSSYKGWNVGSWRTFLSSGMSSFSSFSALSFLFIVGGLGGSGVKDPSDSANG